MLIYNRGFETSLDYTIFWLKNKNPEADKIWAWGKSRLLSMQRHLEDTAVNVCASVWLVHTHGSHKPFLLRHSPPYYFEAGSLTDPGASVLWLVAIKFQKSCHDPAQCCEMWSCVGTHLVFMWDQMQIRLQQTSGNPAPHCHFYNTDV